MISKVIDIFDDVFPSLPLRWSLKLLLRGLSYLILVRLILLFSNFTLMPKRRNVAAHTVGLSKGMVLRFQHL
jgi:hypothetical protein